MKRFLAALLIVFVASTAFGATYTTNYRLYKPAYGESGASWWGPFMSNFDIIDAALSGGYALIFPEAYGAKGDGVTDDSIAIAAAASAALGRELKFAAKTYLFNTAQTFTGKVSGAGKTATTLKTAAAINMVSLGDWAKLSDLTVDGDNKAYSCVLANTTSNVTIMSVRAQNCPYHGFALVSSSYDKLFDVDAINAGNRGIIIDPHSHHIQVIGFHGKNNNSADILIGHDSHHVTVTNFQTEGTKNASIWVHNASYKNVISDGVIYSYAGTSHEVPAIVCGWNCYDTTFSDIQIDSYEIGMLFRGGAVDSGYAPGDTRKNITRGIRFNGPGNSVANSAAIKIDSYDSGTTMVKDNLFADLIAIDYSYGIFDPVGDAALNNNFHDIDFSNGITTTFSLAYTASQSNVHHLKGFTPAGHMASSVPAVPSTGVSATNPFPFAVQIFLKGMPTGGNVSIDGVAVDISSAPNNGNGVYVLGPLQTITLSYGSGTPTWTWFGMP